jgi:exodeoxyribonuclease V alpha subunit
MVVQLRPDSTKEHYTCVGVMPNIVAGESVCFYGEWENHKRFGQQFSVKNYELVKPSTLEGIELLLGSGLVASIGKVRSRSIIETFGLKTLEILDKEPQRLMEVPGIGRKMMEKIAESWQQHSQIRNLMLFLQGYGVSVNLAQKIFKTWGEKAQTIISENPYALIDDIWGVGFIKADAIAQKMGFSHDSFKRIRAGLVYVLQEAANDGHSYLPLSELVRKSAELLEVKEELVVFSLDHVLKTDALIKDEDCIYLPRYFYAEKYIAENLLSRKSLANKKVEENELENWLKNYQKKHNFQADPLQLKAIRYAISNPLFILTGGPGTGKTTILQVIVSFFREKHSLIALAAPTGRAAQRMESVAGLTAKTIHRLLEFKGGASGYDFGRDENNPIEADVIILDEMSMVDVLLMRKFISAVKTDTRLIMVGDFHQLPSVGPGNVLSDLIDSGLIPHVHLKTIFRQAAASRIVTAAHEIITGIVPSFLNSRDDNCFFLQQNDPQQCVELIVDLVSRRLPARYHFNPIVDIQVLSPMHKGFLGTQHLNKVLQKELNGQTCFISRGESCFFLGDKVMQIRNNYDFGVFNGDIGKVVEINDDQGLCVDFDGNRVQYESRELDELVAAYCISIHKSQGCEFKAVIIPVSTQHYIMLQRNLIYTALTRAKQLCVFVGSSQALEIAVRNNEALKRHSKLSCRLQCAGDIF